MIRLVSAVRLVAALLACTVSDTLAQGLGSITRKVYTGIGGSAVSDLTSHPKFVNDTPDAVTFPTLFETEPNFAENYGVQISGYLVPPVTGNYHFFMSSDDQGEVYLSTDDTKANKQLIAREPVWNASRDWLGTNNRNALAPENRSTTLFPAGIPLQGGQSYYIEALMKESGVGDNLALTWQVPGEPAVTGASLPIQGTSTFTNLPGSYITLSTAPASGPVSIETEPSDQTRVVGQAATFMIILSGAPPYTYQWRKDDFDIPAANSASYTTPVLTAGDDGATYSVFVTGQGGASNLTSREAVLTVLPTHPEPQRLAGWQFSKPADRLTLSSGKRNHIFYVGESPAFGWTIAGTATPLNYEVRDYRGNIVAGAVIDSGQSGVSPNVTEPGWYKLYVYGTPITATYGDVIGSTTFVIFRNTPDFPARPPVGTPGAFGDAFSFDFILNGLIGAGPERHSIGDAGNASLAFQNHDQNVALEEQYYLPFDPVRPRKLLFAFPNGVTESQQPAFRDIVDHFKTKVTYFEPRNEPNFFIPPATFATGEMKMFYETVKSVDSNLKVLGPGPVSISPGGHGLGYIEEFLKAGGGNYVDALSLHIYNGVNGDLWLGRKSLTELNKLLARYNFTKPKWQTEQGYFAAMYGAYLPRHQGQWTMMQKMIFEQFGIPKEQDHLWYDVSHGFWDFPTWIENDDGGVNPGAALMRVWSEELHGTNFSRAYDFGPVGNPRYLGSLFTGPGKSVAAFMSSGMTDGHVSLAVTGPSPLHLVSAFGVESTLPVVAGTATLPVSEVPVYVELAVGQTLEVAVPSTDFHTNLARLAGVTAASSGSAAVQGTIDKLFNGVLENWYYSFQSGSEPWTDDSSSFPAWVELDLGAPREVSRVIVFASPPWQGQSSLLDYELRYDASGSWVTLEHIQEPARTFGTYSIATNTTVDSYYSDRWVFEHQFTPVTTSKLRLLVHEPTYGGGATQMVGEAGGQAGPKRIVLREIEVYGPTPTLPLVPTGLAGVGSDQAVTLSWEAASGAVTYNLKRGLSNGGPYVPIATGLAAPGFVDADVTNGTPYYYVVSAENPAGPSADSAQVRVTPLPIGTGIGLKGAYFMNTTHSGPPRLVRLDPTVDFNWGGAGVAPAYPLDHFSVRWTGQVQPQLTATYTFYGSADDVIRVWIDGQLILTGSFNGSGSINLVGGQKYDLRVETIEFGGGADARLEWSTPLTDRTVIPQSQLYRTPEPIGLQAAAGVGQVGLTWLPNAGSPTYNVRRSTTSGTGFQTIASGLALPSYIDANVVDGVTYFYVVTATAGGIGTPPSDEVPATPGSPLPPGIGIGLKGDYFSNTALSGTPTLVRHDPVVNYSWFSDSPAPGLPADNSSTRWTGQVIPTTTETYIFHTITDDGVRVWIDDELIIDSWFPQGDTEWIGFADMVAGQRRNLRMEFVEYGGWATAKLLWSSARVPKAPIPASQLLPSIRVTYPSSGAGYFAPGSVTITAEINGPAPSRVDYYQGATLLGSRAPPFSFIWNNVPAGSYALSARAISPANEENAAVPVDVTVITPLDADADGIPDVWEGAHGLSSNDAGDADADSDGDTMNNRQEYWSGTDPHDPADFLHLEFVPNPGGQGVHLVFRAQPDKTYTIEFRDAPGNGAWQKVTDVPAQSQAHDVLAVDQPPANVFRRFYRAVTPAE